MRQPLNGNLIVTGEFKERSVPGTGLKDGSGVARHIGVDYRASKGTSVYAPGHGTVTQSYTAASGNQIIEIRINGLLWRFMHLSQRLVWKGQSVDEGQVIAKSGNTGGVAAHLHVDVRKDGTAWNSSLNNYRDPREVIAEANKPKPSNSIGKTFFMKPHVLEWSVYDVNTPLPLSRKNRIGVVRPKKYGGLSYKITGNPAANTYKFYSPAYGKEVLAYMDGDGEIR